MTGKTKPYYQCLNKRKSFNAKVLSLILLSGLCLQSAWAQVPADMDEVVVELNVRDIGTGNITALIKNKQAWLSASDMFRFLKINYVISTGGDSLHGFFLNTETHYLLDATQQQSQFNGIITQLPASALMRNSHGVFLRSNLFNTIFKLDCRFDYKSLSVTLLTLLELPEIREKKLALMRNNIGKLRNELIADTTIGRRYAGLKGGMVDWSVNTTNNFKGSNDVRANVIMGGMMAGGEATVAILYNDKTIFSSRQQYYLWRYMNNDNNFLRQVSLGKIVTNATSSIFSPVIGVQFSNSPTVFRRSFGTYRIDRYTHPGWIVELYVNNTLVDYKKADVSGFFSFDVPLVYGNTQVQIRYYGPNGEQRMGEVNISMPFTFLPAGKLEYNVSAGLLEDSSWSKFSRTQVNFGLFKRLTIGGGVEYFAAIANRKTMPFFTANFRISRNMLFTTEYTHGVKSNITGNYHLLSNMMFEVNYTRYVQGQQAIYNTYLEERRAAVSFPFRIKGFNSYSRVSFYQIVLPASRYTTAEALMSGMIFGASTNFTTYALFTDKNRPYLYSNLSVGVRLPGRIIIIPQAQFEYNNLSFISLKGEVEKRISTRGYINGYYERNFKSNFQSINIGIRYNLSFAQVGFALRNSTGNNSSLISSFSGGIVYDSRTGYISLTNVPGVGRGGIILFAYLDINNNGKRDPGEPKAAGLKFIISNGTREENKHDTTMIIRNLEAYNNFFIKIDRYSFDEIAWQIKTGTIKVEIDPNQFKLLEIPISVLGEVSGTIYTQTARGKKTQARILVNIYNSRGIRVAQVLSEADGYFSYLGLPPGSYTMKPDTEQMQKLKLQFMPNAWHFEIVGTIYGDVQRDMDFTLKPEINRNTN